MAKHPTSSRVHRDSAAGPDDPFVGGVERTVAWARKHQRALTIGIVAALVLTAGVLYYVNVQRSIESRAAAEFTQLQATVASGNTQLAIRDLSDFVNRFGSSEAGEQARIVLAEILLYEGQTAEALEALGGLDDDLDEPLGVAAARIRAAAFEAQGNADQAVATYVRVADAARFDFQAREALANAARVRLQNGDAADAVTLYERVLGTFEETEAGRGYYEMWLAEARARAESDDAVAASAAPAASGTPAAEAPAADAAAEDVAPGDTAGQ